ncbi:MAG: galactonate dehydratase [Planctomycetes bacterium]|nr:galactonate dehydratase [Planctomycetota bacterium]
MKKRNSVDNRVDFETRFPTADETMKTWLADGAERRRLSRRRFMRRAAVGLGLVGLIETVRRVEADTRSRAAVGQRESIKITKIETFVLKNSWVFVKISTNVGLVGWGEMLKDRSTTCVAGVKQVEPYLLGKDPRRVVHHWQAIYRHAFYRGGPVLTAVLSGIDQALWDIKGKALGLPVYELLGGPTRDRIHIYGSEGDARKGLVNAFKTAPYADNRQAYRYVESPGYIQRAAKRFGTLREELGPEINIGIDFHGAVQPQTALLLVKAIEPFQPFFFEEVIQCQNVDMMAEIARKTHIPLATGERVFTKWGFREVLEKKAASILQPDVCYAGGITELRLIAGMAESYYVPIAPHNPQGPCSLAASLQIAAAIPNFLIQENGARSYADLLKVPFQQKDSYLPLPTTPGLGIEIDEDKLLAQVGEPSGYPESYDFGDGSVVDW